MGRSSWQENYGGECYTITCLVWSSESTNLPGEQQDVFLGAIWVRRVAVDVEYLSLAAHAWFTWCDHGYFVEITVNIHASLTCIMTAVGINTIPSMDVIYAIFGTLGVLCQTPDEGFPYAT
ncbi:uncharacterized protein LOC130766222 isoform X2 [Actinidia eriantha]|uniref:uncharacterized protein LOC130766222 isoform X2 n=1 Tax=Actinidia eriantha TaxID=165200 RepID=UPI0025903BB6|nr:uncharacterized protein LOC130766222 isoform X2 [Actinidia eriantha]